MPHPVQPLFLETFMALAPSPFARTFLVPVLLLSGLQAMAQDGPLSPQDIQAAWVGKTVVGTIGSGPAVGKPVEFTMNADGTASVAGAAVDTGTWRLSDQGYCATWKKLRGGQERCFTVVRKGTELTVINPDGSVNTAVSQVR